MRLIFLIVLLAGAIYYSYVAFADLNFMTRTGRLGPGFFPRLIGVSAIVILLWALFDERKNAGTEGQSSAEWRDVAILIALAIGYAVLMRIFGGFVSTVIFLAAALSVLNRGRTIQNAIIALLVPAAVYLLFDQVLNASMPPALIDLPI